MAKLRFLLLRIAPRRSHIPYICHYRHYQRLKPNTPTKIPNTQSQIQILHEIPNMPLQNKKNTQFTMQRTRAPNDSNLSCFVAKLLLFWPKNWIAWKSDKCKVCCVAHFDLNSNMESLSNIHQPSCNSSPSSSP